MNLMSVKNVKLVEKTVDFLLVNLIWFVSCLPVVTIFPATAAMFGVVRQQYLRKENSLGIIKSYYSYFFQILRQHRLLNMVWTLMGLIIFVDLIWIKTIEQPFFEFLFSSFSYLFFNASLIMFSAIVHFETDSKGIVLNSATIILSYPFKILMVGITLYIFLITLLTFPAAVLFAASIYTLIVFSYCHSLFDRFAKRKVKMTLQ
ncbi:DUF624 domain-containing protein [Bacillus lacus]|uniref:DUF624 domain-containing protein n=1 Tax=Metabacillus lacus TaxID=1983721 RepID=A0A7X2J006_9BACI|nr:YesL family protein [Metabacillus lacus]MRX72806.1 DUF624 domain-containing protein [Metabacillus lacus]